jgi:hypothetical protein
MYTQDDVRDLAAAFLTLALGVVATYAVAWDFVTMGTRLPW